MLVLQLGYGGQADLYTVDQMVPVSSRSRIRPTSTRPTPTRSGDEVARSRAESAPVTGDQRGALLVMDWHVYLGIEPAFKGKWG